MNTPMDEYEIALEYGHYIKRDVLRETSEMEKRRRQRKEMFILTWRATRWEIGFGVGIRPHLRIGLVFINVFSTFCFGGPIVTDNAGSDKTGYWVVIRN